ncbi:SEC-C metal-binding domain-containing protein [Metabacillus arenae]|uniref:SEC-C domain-containing protein n=1 Tax=Metabacillus arenae TaxID=2771434 RepID=A0A926NDD3_9BACI|nr:SEC-C metal-binding domain-containing protein [Metabacillus arenae]MBD1381404.1 SEC-C domain-containing protein [Metabacillus arenae]
MSVGRNDPCPCGSGKKYKKCCMNSNVVQLGDVIFSELQQIQEELREYAVNHYPDVLDEVLEEIIGERDLSDEEFKEIHLILLSWCVLSIQFEDQETIFHRFCQAIKNKYRPSAISLLEKWIGATGSLVEVTNILDNLHLEVKDIFTNELKTVKLQAPAEIEQGSLLGGFLLPFGSSYSFLYGQFVELFFDIPSFLKEFHEMEGFDDDQAKLRAIYPVLIVDNTFVEMGDMPSVEELEWKNPYHRMVSVLYQNVALKTGWPAELADVGSFMWHFYCLKEDPQIRKPESYAAGLHYFVDTNVPMLGFYTQGEIAKKYGVSAATVSKTYRKLEEGLEEEIEKLLAKLPAGFEEDDDGEGFYEDPFANFSRFETEKALREAEQLIKDKDFDSMEEMNEFLNESLNNPQLRSKPKLSKKDQAQDLLYEALESQGAKRYKLAKQAISLYPNSPDAYAILAENEPTEEKYLRKLKEGVKAGEKDLGKRYFVENKGMFWGLTETRPYMRVKALYADGLYESGQLHEATKQYEEILSLNEMDNQGVRYELFRLYIKGKEYKKANNLLEKYPEEYTAFGVFNTALIEYLNSGLSKKFKSTIENAMKQNPYVADYLSGKKKVPHRMPETYQLGQKDEAIVYAQANADLWQKHLDLIQYLKK